MRVLTISCIYPSEEVDSEGRSVAELDRALAAAGVEGLTLVLRPWIPVGLARRVPRWRHLAVRSRVERRPGLTVVFDRYPHLPRGWRQDLTARWLADRAAALATEHRWEFDVVHGQSVYPAGLAASEVAARTGKPFLVTLRDDLSHLDDRLAAAPRLREPYARLFGAVGAVMVHGPALLRDAPRFLPADRRDRVQLAPNGVDLAGIDARLEGLPESPRSDAARIVSVANLYRFKGIHENLQALKLLLDRGVNRWTYTVVGDGPYRHELEGLARRLGLADRVSFRGAVPHREALRAMRDADLFSLPSRREPFGNVYAEAAACGKPAIGCRGQGAELTIAHGETGLLVPEGDVPALADALQELLADPQRAREMGSRGRRSLGGLTWERTAAQYKQVLERLAGSARTEARA